jgi:hypothetical protein
LLSKLVLTAIGLFRVKGPLVVIGVCSSGLWGLWWFRKGRVSDMIRALVQMNPGIRVQWEYQVVVFADDSLGEGVERKMQQVSPETTGP